MKNVSFIIWVGTVIQVQQYLPQEIRRLYLLFFCIQYCWWEVLCQCNSRISSLSSMSPCSSLFFSLTFFILSFELLALRLSFVLMDIGWSCTYLRMVITFISRSCLAFCTNSHILGVDSFILVVCGPPFLDHFSSNIWWFQVVSSSCWLYGCLVSLQLRCVITAQWQWAAVVQNQALDREHGEGAVWPTLSVSASEKWRWREADSHIRLSSKIDREQPRGHSHLLQESTPRLICNYSSYLYSNVILQGFLIALAPFSC